MGESATSIVERQRVFGKRDGLVLRRFAASKAIGENTSLANCHYLVDQMILSRSIF